MQRFTQSFPHFRFPPDRMKSHLDFGIYIPTAASWLVFFLGEWPWSVDRMDGLDLAVEPAMPSEGAVVGCCSGAIICKVYRTNE
jgi:hypothetical protein